MIEILRAFPDPEVLIALEPEELGSKVLFILRETDQRQISIHHIMHGLTEGDRSRGIQPYDSKYRHAVEAAILEAWSWMEVQGLLVWSDLANGPNGFRRLSRRAKAFANEAALRDYAVATKIQRNMLHPRIAEKVWIEFARSDFDNAVFKAMKEVEIAVREASGVEGEVGRKLMGKAFGPTGPLRDASGDATEEDSLRELFTGANGVFKNSQSHRTVNLADPVEAAEIVMLASLLLRIIDARSPT